MRLTTKFVPLAAALSFAACKNAPKAVPLNDTPGTLQVGAGRATLAEPIGGPTAGYAQSPFLGSAPPVDEPGSPWVDMFPSTRGLQSAPAAKAIVLDNGVTHMVIAKIDAVGMTDVLTDRVIQLTQQAIPGPNGDIRGKLIISGTHTHDATCRFGRTSVKVDLFETDFPLDDPRSNALAHGFDTYSQEITDRIAGSVVQAIVQAQNSIKPAVFGWAIGENYLSGHNRRGESEHLAGYGPGYHDPRVRVLRFDDAATGDPIAVLMNYAMHGTIYDATNHSLSVDAPGHAEYFVEERFNKPVVAMYMQGNAGNVSPGGGGNDGSMAMQYAGNSLADTVMTLYNSITPTQKSIPLQVKERWTEISYDGLGYPPQGSPGYFYKDGGGLCFQLFGNYQNADYFLTSPGQSCGSDLECPSPFGDQQCFNDAQGSMCPPQGPHAEADIVDPNQQICMTQVLPGQGKYSTRFASARIGDIAILAIPGEPVAKVGELLENGILNEFPDVKAAMVFGYSQDHNGYLLMDEDWLSGGYEPTITFWGWRFGAYVVQQGKDVYREMVTGKPEYPYYATASDIPNMQPDPYTPIAATDSTTAPKIDQDVPTTVERTVPIDITWFGGDPTLGHPLVVLQKQNADMSFSDVTKPLPSCTDHTQVSCWTGGWIKFDDVSSYEIPIFYTANPTFKANPTASSRDYHWEAKFEAPIDLPVGAYRFRITGKASIGGTATPYDLTTSAVQITPSTGLTIDSKVAVANGMITFDGTLLYPQLTPVYDTKNPDWQIANYRLLQPRWGNGFSPVTPVGTIPAAQLTPTGGGEQDVPLTYVERDVPLSTTTYQGNPTAGSSLHAEVALTGTAYSLTIPTLTDAYGNTSAPVTLTGQ